MKPHGPRRSNVMLSWRAVLAGCHCPGGPYVEHRACRAAGLLNRPGEKRRRGLLHFPAVRGTDDVHRQVECFQDLSARAVWLPASLTRSPSAAARQGMDAPRGRGSARQRSRVGLHPPGAVALSPGRSPGGTTGTCPGSPHHGRSPRRRPRRTCLQCRHRGARYSSQLCPRLTMCSTSVASTDGP
jgi:hypothetical protein